MSQPDLLSVQIEAFRCSFAAYGDTGVTLAPQAIEHLDALFMAFAVQARELETASVRPPANDPPPLARVLAELEAEKRATDAMAASIAHTNETLRTLRARQDALAAPNIVAFPGARLRGPRIAHGRSLGGVQVETALAVLAGMHNDDGGAA